MSAAFARNGAVLRAPEERRELREDRVCIVEYGRFPRPVQERPRVGFTRDLSGSGMCIGVDEAEPAGTLLRVVLRGVDGSSVASAIARVVWCEQARGGRHWLGLDLVSDRGGELPIG